MKIIFLDIDGVLSSINIENDSISENCFPYSCSFSLEAVTNLKELLTIPDTYLVLSTRWIGAMGFKSTVLALASHGINGPYFSENLIKKDEKGNKLYSINRNDWMENDSNKFWGQAITPKKMSSYKCNEISWWLDDYSEFIDGYVVLDDEFIDWQEDYQVKTDCLIGLSKNDITQAKNILNSGMNKYKENHVKK